MLYAGDRMRVVYGNGIVQKNMPAVFPSGIVASLSKTFERNEKNEWIPSCTS